MKRSVIPVAGGGVGIEITDYIEGPLEEPVAAPDGIKRIADSIVLYARGG